jgi:hypothetical protein
LKNAREGQDVGQPTMFVVVDGSSGKFNEWLINPSIFQLLKIAVIVKLVT